MKSWIYGAGARSFHQAQRPIPYFVVVLDDWPGLDPETISVRRPEIDGSRIELAVQLPDNDELVEVSFFFDLDDRIFIHDLSLLVAVAHFRIHIFRTLRPAGLQLIGSGFAPLPIAVRADLRNALVPKLQTTLRGLLTPER